MRPLPKRNIRSSVTILAQVIAAVALLLVSCSVSPGYSASQVGAHAIIIGVGAGARAFDRLAKADPRPSRRGELNGGIELGYFLTPSLRVSLMGRLGGTFFDFDGAFGSGNASEQSWGGRGGLDWVQETQGPLSPYLGLGYDYGEARSWIRSPLQDDEGPRNIFSGVSTRAGVNLHLSPRLRLNWEILAGGYYAHTFDERLQTRYRWLGYSLGTSIGISCVLLRGAVAQ